MTSVNVTKTSDAPVPRVGCCRRLLWELSCKARMFTLEEPNGSILAVLGNFAPRNCSTSFFRLVFFAWSTSAYVMTIMKLSSDTGSDNGISNRSSNPSVIQTLGCNLIYWTWTVTLLYQFMAVILPLTCKTVFSQPVVKHPSHEIVQDDNITWLETAWDMDDDDGNSNGSKNKDRQGDGNSNGSKHKSKEDDKTNSPTFLVMIMWILYSISSCSQLVSTGLYWIVEYNRIADDQKIAEMTSNYMDLYLHMMKYAVVALLILIDGLVLSTLPVRLKHSIFPILYFGLYFVWTYIHSQYDLGGLVYNELDWKNNPKTSLITSTIVTFVITPIAYVFIWCMSLYANCFRFDGSRRLIVNPKEDERPWKEWC